TLQAERLPRQGRAALFLVRILTCLTSQLAPRAVARQEPGEKALRPARRERQPLRREEAQARDGQGETQLALVCRRARHQREVERRHAGLLRHRPQGRDPLQVGGQPRREGHRRGPGEANPRGGGEREEGSEVTLPTWTFSRTLRRCVLPPPASPAPGPIACAPS